MGRERSRMGGPRDLGGGGSLLLGRPGTTAAVAVIAAVMGGGGCGRGGAVDGGAKAVEKPGVVSTPSSTAAKPGEEGRPNGAATAAKRLRILVGGIRHESNTFSPVLTPASSFKVLRGEAILEKNAWVGALRDAGVEIIPTTLAYTRPFGVVEREAYETFKEEILAGARGAGAVDGVFLNMHGAMHVEGYPDAQADFITALREVIGPTPLVSASFDLHGNISQDFVNGLNILTAFRTAPHVDEDETRARAVKLLLDALARGTRPVVAHVPIPILIPGEKGITSAEPLRSLYARLPGLAGREGILDASIFAGMPWTDVPRAGMSVQVVAASEDHLPAARREAEALALEVWSRRKELDFDVVALPLDAAIEKAKKAAKKGFFITDSGDNTTGGAAGDTTLVLERLLAHGVKDAVFAGIVDKDAVVACENAGVGQEVSLTVGGKIDTVFGKPFKIKGKVTFLTPEAERDQDKRAAVVQVQGVKLVLLAVRRSFTQKKDFDDVNIDPLAHAIVVVKLGYLFPELQAIATDSVLALTSGLCNQVLTDLTYKHVRRPIFPLDADMTWSPSSPGSSPPPVRAPAPG